LCRSSECDATSLLVIANLTFELEIGKAALRLPTAAVEKLAELT